MAVNKNKTLAVSVAVLFFVPSSAHTEVQQSGVVLFVKTKVAFAVKVLGDRISYCEEQKNIASIPVLDAKKVKSINVKRNELLLGLTYLNFNNNNQCQNDAKMKLAYELGILAVVLKHYQLDAKPVKDIESGLVYPSVEEIKLGVSFNKLPENLKVYLQKTVGDRPFDLLKTIKVNRLSRN